MDRPESANIFSSADGAIKCDVTRLLIAGSEKVDKRFAVRLPGAAVSRSSAIERTLSALTNQIALSVLKKTQSARCHSVQDLAIPKMKMTYLEQVRGFVPRA